MILEDVIKHNKEEKCFSWSLLNPNSDGNSCLRPRLKVIVHPKMKILALFTHPQVVPNLYEFLSHAEHKRRYFDELG